MTSNQHAPPFRISPQNVQTLDQRISNNPSSPHHNNHTHHSQHYDDKETSDSLAFVPKFGEEEYELFGSSKPSLYAEIRQLGSGSFGIVHLVRHTPSSTLYACKTLFRYNKPLIRKQIREEIVILSAIQHPFIVKLIDVFCSDAGFTINMVTTNCDSGDIRKLIDSRARNTLNSKDNYTTSQILKWFSMLLLGLHEMHSKHIIHRDIKPENIMLGSGGKYVNIIDFGLAFIFSDVNDSHECNEECGTGRYMSPEMIDPNTSYSFPSDIYSLGLVLFEMITLEFPFSFNTVEEQVEFYINDTPIETDARRAVNVSNEVWDIILRMLDRNPSTRITIRELLSCDVMLRVTTSVIHNYKPVGLKLKEIRADVKKLCAQYEGITGLCIDVSPSSGSHHHHHHHHHSGGIRRSSSKGSTGKLNESAGLVSVKSMPDLVSSPPSTSRDLEGDSRNRSRTTTPLPPSDQEWHPPILTSLTLPSIHDIPHAVPLLHPVHATPPRTTTTPTTMPSNAHSHAHFSSALDSDYFVGSSLEESGEDGDGFFVEGDLVVNAHDGDDDISLETAAPIAPLETILHQPHIHPTFSPLESASASATQSEAPQPIRRHTSLYVSSHHRPYPLLLESSSIDTSNSMHSHSHGTHSNHRVGSFVHPSGARTPTSSQLLPADRHLSLTSHLDAAPLKGRGWREDVEAQGMTLFKPLLAMNVGNGGNARARTLSHDSFRSSGQRNITSVSVGSSGSGSVKKPTAVMGGEEQGITRRKSLGKLEQLNQTANNGSSVAFEVVGRSDDTLRGNLSSSLSFRARTKSVDGHLGVSVNGKL